MKNKLTYQFLVFFIFLAACSSDPFTKNQDNVSSQVGDTVPVISNVKTNFPKKMVGT